MYEAEEILIQQAEIVAAQPMPHVADHVEDRPAALSDIERAIGARQSAENMLSPVYQALRRRTGVDAKRGVLLPRAFNALLLLESQKDSLLFDLHRLQGKPDERTA